MFDSQTLFYALQNGVYLVNNRRNVTKLQMPPTLAALKTGKATFFKGDNRYVVLETLGNPAHVILWDLAGKDTLTVGVITPISNASLA